MPKDTQFLHLGIEVLAVVIPGADLSKKGPARKQRHTQREGSDEWDVRNDFQRRGPDGEAQEPARARSPLEAEGGNCGG